MNGAKPKKAEQQSTSISGRICRTWYVDGLELSITLCICHCGSLLDPSHRHPPSCNPSLFLSIPAASQARDRPTLPRVAQSRRSYIIECGIWALVQFLYIHIRDVTCFPLQCQFSGTGRLDGATSAETEEIGHLPAPNACFPTILAVTTWYTARRALSSESGADDQCRARPTSVQGKYLSFSFSPCSALFLHRDLPFSFDAHVQYTHQYTTQHNATAIFEQCYIREQAPFAGLATSTKPGLDTLGYPGPPHLALPQLPQIGATRPTAKGVPSRPSERPYQSDPPFPNSMSLLVRGPHPSWRTVNKYTRQRLITPGFQLNRT